MNQTVPVRVAAVLRRDPKAFAQALRILDALTNMSIEQRQARAWMIQAVEAEYPAASKAVEDAYVKAEDTGAEVDYVAVLLSAAQL